MVFKFSSIHSRGNVSLSWCAWYRKNYPCVTARHRYCITTEESSLPDQRAIAKRIKVDCCSFTARKYFTGSGRKPVSGGIGSPTGSGILRRHLFEESGDYSDVKFIVIDSIQGGGVAPSARKPYEKLTQFTLATKN